MRSIGLWALLLFLTFASASLAASQRDRDDCEADGERSIRGCTRMIQDRSVSAKDRAFAYHYRASEYLKKGDADRAIADFTQVIRLEPKHGFAYSFRAGAYRAKGDLDRAIADYTTSIRLNPALYSSKHNRGTLYFAKGDYDRAIADYDEVLDEEFSDESTYTDSGWEYVADVYSNRGAAYRAKGDNDRAAANFRRALMLFPKHDDARKGLEETGLKDIAGEELAKSSDHGWCEKASGDVAIAACNLILQDRSQTAKRHALAFFSRGEAYHRNKDYDRAFADYTEAIRLDPKQAKAYHNRGFWYFEKKDYDRAIAELSEAIRLDPKYVRAYGNRANAFRDQGKRDRAIADWRKIIEIEPHNFRAREELQKLGVKR